MSAIFGVVNFNAKVFDFKWFDKIKKSYSEFKFDRIDEISKHNYFFSNNIQWITKYSNASTGLYESERYIINGDIILDNREEVYERLNNLCCDYKKTTDVELFLRAYEKWGKLFCEKIYGDYVFSIYDKYEDILLIGRDHVGNRIIYYTEQDGHFIISSLKASICSPNQSEKLDHINKQWLAIFLQNQSVLHHFDSESTLYNDVYILEPASVMEVSKNGIVKTKYWKPEELKPIMFKKRSYFVSKLKEAVEESVKVRCDSLGEVGGMLSGGLDSSTIASLASQSLSKNKMLYSYTSVPSHKYKILHHPNLVSDESDWVNEVSKKYENVINHYSSDEDLNSINVMDELINTYQMPYKFVENSYWLLSLQKKAREDGCILYLNGNSGNTVMSNGRWEQVMYDLFLKGKWITFIYEVRQYSKIFNYSKKYIYKYFVRSIYNQLFKNLEYNFPMKVINTESYNKYNFSNVISRIGYSSKPFCSVRHEILSLLEGPILNHTAEVDNLLDLKLGMRNRDPSIDVRVIEVMLRTPMKFLANKGRSRALLKDAMVGIVPNEILQNEVKRGKQAIDWVHRLTCDWDKMILDLEATFLTKKLVQELIDKNTFKTLLDKNRILVPDKADPLEIRLILWFYVINKFLDFEERR